MQSKRNLKLGFQEQRCSLVMENSGVSGLVGSKVIRVAQYAPKKDGSTKLFRRRPRPVTPQLHMGPGSTDPEWNSISENVLRTRLDMDRGLYQLTRRKLEGLSKGRGRPLPR